MQRFGFKYLVLTLIALLTANLLMADELVVYDNTIFTLSTVYNGQRYYLGIDTIAAKQSTPVYQITTYTDPCHAALWTNQRSCESCTTQALYSKYMKDKSIDVAWTATISSNGTYCNMGLVRETESIKGAAFNMDILDFIQNVILNLQAYYTTTVGGMPTKFYLTYDPIYGFSRMYQTRPASPLTIHTWAPESGLKVTADLSDKSITLGFDELTLEASPCLEKTLSFATIYANNSIKYVQNADPTIYFYEGKVVDLSDPTEFNKYIKGITLTLEQHGTANTYTHPVSYMTEAGATGAPTTIADFLQIKPTSSAPIVPALTFNPTTHRHELTLQVHAPALTNPPRRRSNPCLSDLSTKAAARLQNYCKL